MFHPVPSHDCHYTSCTPILLFLLFLFLFFCWFDTCALSRPHNLFPPWQMLSALFSSYAQLTLHLILTFPPFLSTSLLPVNTLTPPLLPTPSHPLHSHTYFPPLSFLTHTLSLSSLHSYTYSPSLRSPSLSPPTLSLFPFTSLSPHTHSFTPLPFLHPGIWWRHSRAWYAVRRELQR